MLILGVAGTLLILATAATLLRNREPRWRWTLALAIFVVLTASWMSATHAPQSIWLNVPVVGGAMFASVFAASRGPLRHRPAIAFIASLGAAACGFFVGMVTAIELGLLRLMAM